MEQLDQTIEAQLEVVEIRQQALEQQRRCWTTTRIDSKKIHKVVEKLQQQERVEQDRREQKLLDEFSQSKRKSN